MATIEDNRKDKSEPWAFVVCTDSFLSNWPGTGIRRSLYAVAVASPDEAEIVMDNARHRTEMKRPRLVTSLQRLKRNVHKSDHLTISDRHFAERMYEPGAFAADAAARKAADA